MGTEYETLANTVQKTLDNLQNKKNFLVDQQYNYNIIREKLLNFKQNKNASNEEESIEQKGDVFGDIIISSNKIFLGIGYDYYIEKTVDEAIEFVEDKLKLMDDAIEQFDLRINEASETLKNLKMLIHKNEVIQKSNQTKQNNDINNKEIYEDNDENILPTMEIREELDEEGNVINGSVVPAATDEERQKIEDLISNKLSKSPDTTQKIVNKSEPKIEEVNDGREENCVNPEKVDSITTNNIDTNEIYSFEDLVKQMDQQDEEDDGMIDSNDVDYNYDYSKLQNNIIADDNDDEDEYYEEEYDDEIYDRMPGHSSFMDQLNKLRISRGQLEKDDEEEEILEQPLIKPVSVTGKEPEKSIMKITTQEESEAITTATDEKKKIKKSVGFAQSLDVHEVESFKKETKQQTFNFPRRNDDLYSMVQDIMTDDTNNPKLNEFDNDLFASMIGAKPSDELHDKYKNQLDGEEEQEEEQETQKKARVSRFKRDRGNIKKNEPVVQERDVVEEIDRSGNRAVVDTIVERDVTVVEVEPKPKKKLSRFAQNRQSKQENPTHNSQGIVKDIVEHAEPKKSEGIVKDIIDHEDDIIPSNEKTPHFQQKKMRSLNKPRQSLNKTPAFPKELLDEELVSDEENESIMERIKPVIPTPKTEEIIEDEKATDDELIFPKEVKEAIKKIGKTEDSLRVANVDYSMLVDNMDDMIQAYSLGMYDDDLEEHPGTVVESIEDFTTYNKQVDELKDEIIDFKKKNPMVGIEEEIDEEQDNDPNSNVIMTDIVEKDIPVNYRDIEEEYENNLGLHPHNISEAVNKEYHTLRQQMLQQMQNLSISDDKEVQTQAYKESLGVEPIDAEGNAIRVSRFKSQRMKLDNPMNN
ncbi:hypothetical protein C6P45_000261 [Maudiozyma exigua]|uniref:DUF3835 domain-containing protein n=1 Tax=Maudiozyma exigua TaxID=34358 RepID=A0A9P6W7S4_MAUEX|nr:hypothetical protein C6P45_000261 [Kazachstania exigua]